MLTCCELRSSRNGLDWCLPPSGKTTVASITTSGAGLYSSGSCGPGTLSGACLFLSDSVTGAPRATACLGAENCQLRLITGRTYGPHFRLPCCQRMPAMPPAPCGAVVLEEAVPAVVGVAPPATVFGTGAVTDGPGPIGPGWGCADGPSQDLARTRTPTSTAAASVPRAQRACRPCRPRRRSSSRPTPRTCGSSSASRPSKRRRSWSSDSTIDLLSVRHLDGQRLAGARQPRLRGPDRDAQLPCDLLDRQVDQVVEDEDLAMAQREPAQRSHHGDVLDRECRPAVWRAEPVAQAERAAGPRPVLPLVLGGSCPTVRRVRLATAAAGCPPTL